MKKINYKLFLFFTLTAFFVSVMLSCDIGLGAFVYMDGPVVEIISPVSGETDIQVPSVFNLTGTAESKSEVTRMEIKLDFYDRFNNKNQSHIRLGREWLYENGRWNYRPDSNAPWRVYREGDYFNDVTEPVEPPSWTVSGETVYWNIPILLSDLDSGDFFITVNAWDAPGYHDSESSKRLKVYYNNNEPQFNIEADRFKFSFYHGILTGSGSMSNPDIPKETFNTFTYDPVNNPQKTYTDINTWVTDEAFSIYWRIDDASEPPLNLVMEFTNRHELGSGSNKIVYFHKEIEINTRYGTIVIDKNDIKNWAEENNITLEKHERTYMQIVTRLTDEVTGNEQLKSQGFFAYLPDAENPWTTIAFGSKEYDSNKFMTLEQRNSDSVAYGKNFLKSISWKLIQLNDDLTEKAEIKSSSTNLSGNRDSEGWIYTADSGTGPLKIVVTATDTNNNTGEYTAFFNVEDSATPKVTEITTDLDNPLFGDGLGNITISGKADIAASSQINKVTLAWIMPNLPNRVQARQNYTNRNYTNWFNTSNGFYHDQTNGVMIWDMNISAVVPDGDVTVYDFAKNLNLFSDLNIKQVSPMEFIIRVAASNDTPSKPRATTYTFSTTGDTSPPQLTLTLHIKRAQSSTLKDEVINLQGTDRIPTIGKGDTIWFTGTWDDDSRKAWHGLTETVLKELFGKLKVKWDVEGEANDIVFDIVSFLTNPNEPAGTWETNKFTFEKNNEDAIVILDISLSDLSGNEGGKPRTLMIAVDNPTLERITSRTNDGVYGPKKDTDVNIPNSRSIIIELLFNMPVKFYDNVLPSQLPYLMLNNGGRANYLYDNSTSFTFEYLITDASLSSEGRLNVTSFNPGYGCSHTPGSMCEHFNNWVGIDSPDTIINVPAGVFIPDYITSLAGSKNIVIDNKPPIIVNESAARGFTSTTAAGRAHGTGSTVNITVNFNETIVVTGATANNLYLSLGGITGSPAAVARFTNVTGPRSIGFSYKIDEGQDSGNNYISVTGFIMGDGVTIRDTANNDIVKTPSVAIANSTIYNGTEEARLRVDTTKPNPPSITVISDRTYYTDTTFRITGLLSDNNSMVEFTLNYNGDQSVWTNPIQTIEHVSGVYYVDIPLTTNGSYQIAARQYDNANPRNRSEVSVPVGTVSKPVIIDKGNLLERITSSTPDGIYPEGKEISIDLVFRKPLWFTGEPHGAIITLNNDQTARLESLNNWSNDRKTWTFTFTSSEAVEKLDVTALNIYGSDVHFWDAESNGTEVNNWIQLNSAHGVDSLPVDNRLYRQKSIQILTGSPKLGSTTTLGNGIVYNSINNQIRFTFDRPIYRGDTDRSAVIRQIPADYRIPAVLSVEKYNKLFVGRTDLNLNTALFAKRPPAFNSNSDWWNWIGTQLYQQGSNGASSGFVSDTTVKYVLRYDISTTVENFPDGMHANMPPYSTNDGITGLREMFREAEALHFGVNDKDVKIENNVLILDLSSSMTLPVKGAEYQIILPAGYVKDFLEQHNGGWIKGNDSNYVNIEFSSTGVESPVIRINKGEDRETFSTTLTGNNRQAIQPLESKVKIDSRTPGAEITYRTQQTTDNVGRLIWRDNPGTLPNRLPNLGNQEKDDFTSYNAARNRPQSGNTANTFWNASTGLFQSNNANGAVNYGLNLWAPMAQMSGAFISYVPDFTIGSTNYNDGGMIIHIEARAVTTAPNAATATSYETAYRSVFVFNNVAINGNSFAAGNNNNGRTNVGGIQEGGQWNNTTGILARMWIRGGDKTSGEPSVPDFPISRNRNESRKARLLTPILVNSSANPITIGPTGNTVNFNNRNNAINAEITNAHIPTEYSSQGNYLWFWVTWKLNVNAYVDFFAGELPSNVSVPQVPQNQKDMYYGFIMAKEHYPVIPGRTTVVETRDSYQNYVDGGHGVLAFGSVSSVPNTGEQY